MKSYIFQLEKKVMGWVLKYQFRFIVYNNVEDDSLQLRLIISDSYPLTPPDVFLKGIDVKNFQAALKSSNSSASLADDGRFNFPALFGENWSSSLTLLEFCKEVCWSLEKSLS